MAISFEPASKETWIECLGDLGRYTTAIEDDDIRDREVWTQVLRERYPRAPDRALRDRKFILILTILTRRDASSTPFWGVRFLRFYHIRSHVLNRPLDPEKNDFRPVP
jgi:hypothetical protein